MPPLAPKAGHLGLILPLATSSATLGLALFQYPIFYAFLHHDADDANHIPGTLTTTASSTSPSLAGRPLSQFWTRFLTPTATAITALSAASGLGGALAARWLATHATLETSQVGRWYLAGAVLSVAHLAFAPLVAAPIGRMVDRGRTKGEEEGEAAVRAANEEDMRAYLVTHSIRTVAVDLTALVCFAEGVALSFWITH